MYAHTHTFMHTHLMMHTQAYTVNIAILQYNHAWIM